MIIVVFCRSTAMIPDYAKGKESAIRILKLNNRQSKMNPEDTNGIVLVSSSKLRNRLRHRFIL